MSVHVLVTLDTKGPEAAFLRESLLQAGVSVTLVDVGTHQPPTTEPDVTREEVREALGKDAPISWDALGRGDAVAAAARGATQLMLERARRGEVSGVLAIGGSAGSTIGSAVMRAMPLSMPKILVSTMASGDVRPYVGDRNLMMVNAVVDFAGMNRISRTVLGQAAAAMAGMVLGASRQNLVAVEARDDRPIVAATMFGVTTPCVQQARAILESAGYEVLVFHANGAGGRALESLAEEGMLSGVLDITTTELADELVGGVLSAGPHRLEAAGRRGVPQVVSVGALDMVNFGPRETVPEKFATRQFHVHNPTVTLMRTTAAECETLGRILAQKVSQAKGPAQILFPALGISAIDRAGQSFDDPQAREALWRGLTSVESSVPLKRIDAHINDPAFAKAAAERLLALMQQRAQA